MPIRINPKPKSKPEPDFLCTWSECTSCVGYRKRNKLPMPKLRPFPRDNHGKIK